MRLFIVFCACGLALVNCADPTEGKPDAVVGDVIAEAPVAATPDNEPSAVAEPPADVVAETPAEPVTEIAGTKFRLVENSGVQFQGSKVTGTHVGGFAEYDGVVTVPEGGIEAATIDVTIDMTSVFSDAGGLTEKLRGEEFFEVETFPTASFKSTSIAKTDAGYDVTGNFNLHGVTRSITFPATVAIDGKKLTAQSEFVIKQFDWGIKYRGLGEDLIRDEVLVLLDIEATAE